LDDLVPEVEAFNLELQIKDQDETVAKAEKKLKGLQDDQESMEKKIKKLEDDLKNNAKDQQDQQKEIEKQRQILEGMKGKRKG
jgi:septal ring factor EnvC (AmiA/AmiB activator)